MVDTARQLLDELMGRNRNLDPNTARIKKVQWDDPEFCLYHLVKFCPHELFVNTRADLGQCTKLHDDEAKRLFDECRPSAKKRSYEDEFLRFSNHMINEVDRKIEKGRQRLLLMNKTTEGTAPPVYVSKYQEQINNLNARIKKLIGEAEEAGNRGDVDQAQGLMTLCDQLKEEKEELVANHEANEGKTPENGSGGNGSSGNGGGSSGPSGAGGSSGGGGTGNGPWNEYQSNEKQMEVCEVCGAFLIVGDAQQRIEDHLSGKQHLGYSRLRKAVEEMYEKRQKERDDEERQLEQDRRHKLEMRGGGGGGGRNYRRNDDFNRDRRRDRYNNHRDRDNRDRDHRNNSRFHNRHDDRNNHHKDRRDRDRERDRDRRSNRSRSRSNSSKH